MHTSAQFAKLDPSEIESQQSVETGKAEEISEIELSLPNISPSKLKRQL